MAAEQQPSPEAGSPIADLSYRNYVGPLASPRFRWWVIAKMGIGQALKKKMFWVFGIGSGWYYLAMIFVLFVMDQIATGIKERGGNGGPAIEFLGRIIWKDQFVHGFSFGQLAILLVTLILGAGSIANDNRANALLVYLSKPCTKWDYVFGKWMGVFIPLLCVISIPSLFFWLYAAMSYRDQGFFFQDPWLIAKLFCLLPVAAAFLASLIVGFSSMFNQGRIAGATFAGLYFLSNFFTQLMVVTWVTNTSGRRRGDGLPIAMDLVARLYHASVDGLEIGAAKAILRTDGSPYFGIPNPRAVMIPQPPLLPILAIMAGLSALALFVAWRRIRAVEVVG